MPFVQFSYPVGGHPVGEPVHLSEEKASAHVRDGVAVACDPPEVKTPRSASKPKAAEAKRGE